MKFVIENFQSIHDNDSTIKTESLKEDPKWIYLRSVVPQGNNMKIVHFWQSYRLKGKFWQRPNVYEDTYKKKK
jgi:hypothetical protein